jgi:membrane associated rhomboid family serine protease/Zn-finger nucleic acid-binding protein
MEAFDGKRVNLIATDGNQRIGICFMFTCPRCQTRLRRNQGQRGIVWTCTLCNGRAMTVGLLRHAVDRHAVNQLWLLAQERKGQSGATCPSCRRSMIEVSVPLESGEDVLLDVCKTCHMVWFDTDEITQLPPSSKEVTKGIAELPMETRKALALEKIKKIKDDARGPEFGMDRPQELWKYIPALIGMPIEHDRQRFGSMPWLTWLIVVIAVGFSMIAFLEPGLINRFAMIPNQATRLGGLTLVTSFFLHGGVFHLVGNMYFLMVFGDNVEDYLGKLRFVILLLLATVGGDLLHILLEPRSDLPTIGASGGISGVLAFYALQFPGARLGTMFWFRWIHFPAWAGLVYWLAFQVIGVWLQMSGYSNVSASAHVGGASIGFGAWLLWRTGNRKSNATHVQENSES